MKTIATKFDWTIYDIKKIREVITYGKSLHLTSERFFQCCISYCFFGSCILNLNIIIFIFGFANWGQIIQMLL
uniref:Uncharacterized protein n=1 Tax=Meloidogyne incognita TaxID=6306 RepID=A0A914NUJ9_MELIC